MTTTSGVAGAMQGRGLLYTLACLMGTGVLLALSTVLAKISASHGLAPLPYLAWSSLGAGILLFALAAARGITAPWNLRTLEYSFFSSIFGMAGPFMLIFTAVSHVGISFVALAIAFPPLFTYVGALLLGMERFALMRASGVALALIGAAIIALYKLGEANAPLPWIAATLTAPVLLAVGNLYRTRRWPPGARPEALAPCMLGGSGILLISLAVIPGVSLSLPTDRTTLLLVAAQIANFTVQYTLFFILQHRGGPVMLSLIGAVSAVVGVPFAILVLGEAAPSGLFISAILILAGVWLTSWGGLRQQRRAA
ncbi:DMT family transporter [Polymorphobacter sp.]|uniref:DMT family transporter n=1 Tax=Polymorphobacter sp. TaxID=1909290 RepID=UPI003F721D3B